MSDPLDRLERAREQLELLRSYGNDSDWRGDQARGDIAAAEAELAAAEPDPPAEPEQPPLRRRGK